MKFSEWLKQVDASQIEQVYDKAKISVDLVRKYRPDLLQNISVIANLAAGAYGVYTHFQVQDQQMQGLYYGPKRMRHADLRELPKQLFQQHFQGVDASKLQGDIIKININRILQSVKTDLQAVQQIAGVIAHESVHQSEVQKKGNTLEINPTMTGRQFVQFLNQPQIVEEIISALQKYPVSSKTVGR